MNEIPSTFAFEEAMHELQDIPGVNAIAVVISYKNKEVFTIRWNIDAEWAKKWRPVSYP